MSSQSPLEDLRTEWLTLHRDTLPNLSRSKDPAQSHWPVTLDHCFARIILDNSPSIGSSKQPWTDVIAKPAYKNMNEVQLRDAIALGRRIADGSADLVELDEASLECRGKKIKNKKRPLGQVVGSREEGGVGDGRATSTKKRQSRKGEMADIWARYSFKVEKRENHENEHKHEHEREDSGLVTPKSESEDTPSASKSKQEQGMNAKTEELETCHDADLEAVREKIKARCGLTPFRKQVLTLLTQVPRGRFTTYKALSDAIAQRARSAAPPKAGAGAGAGASATGCARAIGSAMRNNPFAPAVPCHRVLAANGDIGGFKGDWGDEGRFVAEKRRLLREEGVKFDGRGKVVGSPFVGFQLT